MPPQTRNFSHPLSRCFQSLGLDYTVGIQILGARIYRGMGEAARRDRLSIQARITTATWRPPADAILQFDQKTNPGNGYSSRQAPVAESEERRYFSRGAKLTNFGRWSAASAQRYSSSSRGFIRFGLLFDFGSAGASDVTNLFFTFRKFLTIFIYKLFYIIEFYLSYFI